MSEATRKLRSIEAHTTSVCGVRDLAADAIEAVEAQVAEAVARVAALEPKPAMALSAGPPEGGFRVGDRVMALDIPSNREFRGLLGTIVPCEYRPQMDRLVAVALDKDPEGLKVRTSWPVGELALVSRPEPKPAPSAVTAPRGFRVGDRVRITKARDCSRDWIGCEGRIVAECNDSLLGDWRIGDLSKFKYIRTVPMFGENLTLVRAADAPEAPAEDAGLVERLARIIVDTPCAANHEGQCIPPGAPVDDCDRANARAVLSDLTAESRLCAPGEVARLKDELAEANGARFLNANAVRLQKARAEAAEKELAEARAISAATAERVRNETQIATELRHDLADANDRLTSQSRSIEEMHAELAEAHKWRDDLRAKLAAAEQAHAELLKARMECASRADGYVAERDALRAEVAALKAKPRSRTRPVTAADVRALDDEWAKSKYVGRNSWVLAMRALGFRRRVDGAK